MKYGALISEGLGLLHDSRECANISDTMVSELKPKKGRLNHDCVPETIP